MDKPIFQWEENEAGQCTARLRNGFTTNAVFWSEQGNSFVLIEDEKGDFIRQGVPVFLASINGLGEVRWIVHPHDCREGNESWKAADHFGFARAVKILGDE